MEREEAICKFEEEVGTRVERKYVLSGDTAFINIGLKMFTHGEMCVHEKINLGFKNTKGGILELQGGKFVHTYESMSIEPSSQEMLDMVTNIEIVDLK